MMDEPLIVDEACWERGCACHDSRDSPGIQLVELREWVELTPAEILDSFDAANVYGSKWIEFARSVEAKLKEKNSVTRMGNGSATTKPVA